MTESELKRKREQDQDKPTIGGLQQEIKEMSYILRDVCAKLDKLEKTLEPERIKAEEAIRRKEETKIFVNETPNLEVIETI